MSDDRSYGYDDPDELANAWRGVPMSLEEFDRLTVEPWCPEPGEAFFDDSLDR
jgi:hypothetical protein